MNIWKNGQYTVDKLGNYSQPLPVCPCPVCMHMSLTNSIRQLDEQFSLNSKLSEGFETGVSLLLQNK